MGCGSCGGSRPAAVTPTSPGQQQASPGPRWQVALPNGGAIAATSEWDAIQKQAMYGGAIREIDPTG